MQDKTPVGSELKQVTTGVIDGRSRAKAAGL